MIKDVLIDLDLDNEKYLVVGCSAGPDSMALLHYLKNNTKIEIVCAHINHNVRKESLKEEQYLKKFCKDHEIIFESVTLGKFIEKNFENEARKKRYEFYEEVINKYQAKYLFLAHHGDDLVETILMKINRGSNLEGYAGIKKIAKKNNYYIIRPLLEYTKQDLIYYNEIHGVKYFVDKSNFDLKYTRNRFRCNILPQLKSENSKIHKMFIKFSETLLEYNSYVEDQVNKVIKEIYYNNYIDLKKFKYLHPLIKKNILYKILSYYYDSLDIVKEKNILDILKLIDNSKPNLFINLPQNKVCVKEYDKVYIKDNDILERNYKLELKDVNEIDNILIEKIHDIDTDGNDICRLNTKKIKLPIYIRNRRDGDFIEIKGLNGRKKVKDVFIDKKIPKEKRDRYPLLVDSDNNILWIPNIKKSKFNTQKGDFCDIILRYCEKEENDE